MSKISVYHLIKLIFRSVAFVGALILYIINRIKKSDAAFGGVESKPAVLWISWLFFVVEMILRLFPSRVESMGCQKQFAKNYISTGTEEPPKRQSGWRTFIMVALWLGADGFVGALYLLGIIDSGILVLYCLLLSVLDMMCILFFCPFQTFVMKNKCCGTCRVYNWDYIMIFTPLIFIPNVFTVSMVAIAFLLFIVWELLYRKYPERFTENTNCSLSCANCEEKLCYHKKQLRRFLKKQKENLKGKLDIRK